MSDTTIHQTDSRRPRDGYFFLVDTLSATLPEPPNETPEIRYQHMQAAIAAVAGWATEWPRPGRALPRQGP